MNRYGVILFAGTHTADWFEARNISDLLVQVADKYGRLSGRGIRNGVKVIRIHLLSDAENGARWVTDHTLGK